MQAAPAACCGRRAGGRSGWAGRRRQGRAGDSQTNPRPCVFVCFCFGAQCVPASTVRMERKGLISCVDPRGSNSDGNRIPRWHERWQEGSAIRAATTTITIPVARAMRPHLRGLAVKLVRANRVLCTQKGCPAALHARMQLKHRAVACSGRAMGCCMPLRVYACALGPERVRISPCE